MSRRSAASATSWRICRCARDLADAHGFDGFTMEQLATAAEVSRRTVFNHFAGKVDAVLGPMPQPSEESLATFRGGGASGDLVLDLRDLADTMLGADGIGRDELVQVRRLLLANPRLLVGIHDRFRHLSELLVEEIQAREGPQFGRRRAAVAVGVLASLFGAALEAFLEDDVGERRLAGHFDECITLARELFG